MEILLRKLNEPVVINEAIEIVEEGELPDVVGDTPEMEVGLDLVCSNSPRATPRVDIVEAPTIYFEADPSAREKAREFGRVNAKALLENRKVKDYDSARAFVLGNLPTKA